ncbi:hypothetical protein MTO96_046850 [Rhipicephalus appendiculatus]
MGFVIGEPKLRRGVVGLAVAFSFPWLLDKLAFGKKGIKTFTVAAAYQAYQHSQIQSPSVFSDLQSWGVKGVPGEAKFYIGYYTFIICYAFCVFRLVTMK